MLDSLQVTARGETDSPPSEPIVFQTGDGGLCFNF